MTRTTYKLSTEGLQKVERLRKLKGWGRTSKEWAGVGMSSESTLKRFLGEKPISTERFIALCNALGIEHWQELVDWPPDVKKDSTRVIKSEKQESENLIGDNSTKSENSQSKYGLAVTGVFSADKKLEIEAALQAVKNLLLSCQIIIQPQKND